MRKFIAILIVATLVAGQKVRADEGMWLLPLIEKLNIGKMTELGLKLSADDIYSINKASIKDAIVIFGRGCTGEIVSSEGLLFTNHHCGYSQIQAHSSVEHDYLKEGYWAMTRDQELPNPGLTATFLLSIEDVTDKVLASVKPGMSETERTSVINNARGIIEENAASGDGIRATVTSFYGGNYFYLLIYEIYSDVRFVGAPPSSIGKFGFDTDNWEWPRHTGDFSIFRVYTGPDGKPAPYAADNIPLKPKHWLPVSVRDLNKGDFAMIMGYPGSTERYATSYEVNELLSITDPNRIKIRGIRQEILMADMQNDPKVNIQYASKYSSSSNYWKNSIGEKEGLEKLNVKARKEEIEDQYNRWVTADKERQAMYGNALELIRSSVQGRAEYINARQYINECFLQGSELVRFNLMSSLYHNALKTGDHQRISNAASWLRNYASSFYKDYNPPTDKKSTIAMINLYRKDVPEIYHPSFFKEIIDRKFKGNVEKYVDDMFSKSVFSSQEKLIAFLEKPSLKTLEADPVQKMAASVNEMSEFVSDELSKFDDDYNEGHRLWVAALKEMTPEKTLYPDANFTMRLTYGTVRDYDPRDGVTYKYYTTLKGVIEKYKPDDYEFDLPERLIDLHNRKEYGRYASSEGYLPVNFLTDNDITGGNSGSPVLNAKGELIGLAFDGNWEAMSGDVAFEPELQRTISVDIRYVLWVIDIYAGAKHLIDEMTIAE
ncbi:MAG: S46 family peptidase [Bacteroidales bacterium]|jgi:hypothetical protein